MSRIISKLFRSTARIQNVPRKIWTCVENRDGSLTVQNEHEMTGFIISPFCAKFGCGCHTETVLMSHDTSIPITKEPKKAPLPIVLKY